MPKPVLLIIDDNEALTTSLRRALLKDYEIRCAHSQDEALKLLSPPPDVILLDLRLVENEAENRDGVLLLQTIHSQFPELPVLMHTAHGDVDLAVECIRLGAVDFIQKSRADIKEIKTRISKALDQARLLRRVTYLEEQLQLIEPREIVGLSPEIQEVKHSIDAVAKDGDVTVLIRGESGTGKELVARAIHANGRRARGPFIPVVLAALPSHLVESELFGYEQGAFTDAKKRHLGYLERANGGVLFLDEIGELDAQLQVKLLRFLEERELHRLGSTNTVVIDVQVVAATNADLRSKIKEGKFREDLYFRLTGFEIEVPPLRDRPSDIPILVNYFLTLFQQQGRKTFELTPKAIECLFHYSWPGNIRQLKNSLESALFRASYRKHQYVEVEDLPADISGYEELHTLIVQPQNADALIELDEALSRTELDYIERALQLVKGRKTEAWKLLGLNDRFALRRRVKRILERYPALLKEYPLIREAYESEGTHK